MCESKGHGRTGGLLLRLFSSVRLFIVIATVTGLLAIVATLVPQGEGTEFYTERFGEVVGAVLQATGLASFFRSTLLLVLAAAALGNLVLCTVPRMIRRLQRLARVRRGPKPMHAGTADRVTPKALLDGATKWSADIVHVGLIVLIACGLVALVAVDRETFFVATGETVQFRGLDITVVDSREIVGQTGGFENAVLAWELDASVKDTSGEAAPQKVILRLNQPWRQGGLQLHFAHWSADPVIELVGEDEVFEIESGQGFEFNEGGSIILFGAESGEAVFVITDPGGIPAGEARLSVGEQLGPFRISSVGLRVTNGFLATYNPVRPGVIAGLVILSAGMVLLLVKAWGRIEPDSE